MNRAIAAETGDVYCAKCDGGTGQCSACSEGSRLLNGECVRCREDMHHCHSCDSKLSQNGESRCKECYKNVAELDSSGKCTKCIAPWQPVTTADGSQKCQCNAHINVKAGMKCQTCADLIPGCVECQQTDYPARGQIIVDVGDDPTTRNDKSGSFVICKRAEDPENMFQVRTTQNGITSIGYKRCDDEDVVPGCKKCKRKDGADLDVLPVCEACSQNHYLVQDSGDKTKCLPCSKWGNSCTRCNLQAGCTHCGEAYWNMGGICVKSWF